MARKILGELFGIEIIKHKGEKDSILQLLLEDDENWHVKCAFSSHWLDDLIDILKATQTYLRTKT